MKKVKIFIKESVITLSDIQKEPLEMLDYRCSVSIEHLISWIKKSLSNSMQRVCFESVFSEAMPFRDDIHYYNYLLTLVGLPYDEWLQKKYFPEDLHRIDRITSRIRKLNAEIDHLSTKIEKDKSFDEMKELDTLRDHECRIFAEKLCKAYEKLDTYQNFSEFLKVMFTIVNKKADAEELIFINAGSKSVKAAFNKALSKKKLVKGTTEPTGAQWALYHIYRQRSGEEPEFPQHGDGREIKMQEVAAAHELHLKTFQLPYNRFLLRPNRIKSSNKKNLEAVNTMLSNSPGAQKIAIAELKIADTLSK